MGIAEGFIEKSIFLTPETMLVQENRFGVESFNILGQKHFGIPKRILL